MRYGALALGALLGASSLPTLAAAQVSPRSMLQGATPRTISLEARTTTDYNSNVSRTNSTGASLTGVSPGDTTITPSVTADIIQPIGRQAVFLNGSISYRFHDKNKQLDSSRINLDGGVGGSVGPCGAVLDGRYSRGRSELTDITLDTTVQNIRELKEVDVSVACTRPTGLGLLLSGGRRWGSSSLQQFALSDSETTTGSAGISYGRPSLGSASVFTSYSKTDYPNRPTQTPGTSGFQTQAVGASYERQLGGRIKATGSIGFTQAKQTGPLVVGALPRARANFSGVTYGGALSYRASSRLFIEGDLQRQVSPTLISVGSYEIQTNYSLNATYRLGTRLSLRGGGQHSKIDLNGAVFASGAPTLTNSRTDSGFASLTYKQSKRVSLSLGGGIDKRSSDNPLFNYTNNHVSLSIAVTY